MNDIIRLRTINYALKDISETLSIWRDEKSIKDPYMVKLWKEWDEKVEEKQKLLKTMTKMGVPA